MTLMDAPKFDARRATLTRNLTIAGICVVVLGALAFGLYRLDWPWQVWNWSAASRINTFFATVESGDLQKAYGVWNHDPAWQQHPDRYKPYGFEQFEKDWGTASDYGKISSHKIILAVSRGNGVVAAVNINGGKTPIFLRVDNQTDTVGFSPIEIYAGP
jgi:hypothetical protein